jgi:hypothetical protein
MSDINSEHKSPEHRVIRPVRRDWNNDLTQLPVVIHSSSPGQPELRLY